MLREDFDPQMIERMCRPLNVLIALSQTILTHSRSRVVLQVLKKAAGKNIKVYVTESRPDNSG